MDVGYVAILFAIGLLLDLLKKLRERDAARRPPPMRLPPVVAPPATPARHPRVDRDWRRALDQAGPLGRHPDHALQDDEDVEEAESLEVAPEVVSLEVPVRRVPRQLVDHDEASRLAVARRIKEAAARDRAHTRADHRQFDARIRKDTPQPAPRPTVATRAAMREAMKWREILHRPVGWRDE